MKVDVEQVESCVRRLTIEVSADRVGREFSTLYRDLQKRVKIPGFRPGKVPRRILENQYRHSVEQEVLQNLVPSILAEAMTQEGISPIGRPQIDQVNIQQGKPLRFIATAQVLPEFEVSDYQGWEFERRIMQIEPSHIDRHLERMRERHAELYAVSDRAIAEGDHVIINYESLLHGQPMENGTGTNMSLEVGEGMFLPEIEQGLIGLEQGAEKSIPVVFGEDHHDEMLAGQTVEFKVTVVEIKEKVLPELDDDFAQSYEDEDTLEALRQRSQGELEEAARRDADNALHRELLGKLVETHPIDVPDVLVQEQMRQMYLQHRRMTTGQEPSHDDMHMDTEPLREAYGEQAIEVIRGQVLLHRLEEDLKLSVSPEDVDAEIADMASRMAQNAEALKQTLERSGGLDTIRGRLQERRVFQALIDTMQITDKVVSEAELAPADSEDATDLQERGQ